MIDNENLNPRETLKLVGYDKKFNFIKSLFLKNNLPKVILFSGEKGIGKSTFVSHLMHFFFDKANYDLERKIIVKKDMFHNQYTNLLKKAEQDRDRLLREKWEYYTGKADPSVYQVKPFNIKFL